MLLELNVKDIALIKKASVEFGSGLNILTGETGAGKSVIIDSAMLALGSKVRGDMIRNGAEYAYIELIFAVEGRDRKDALKSLGFAPDEDGSLIISRKIMPGRSVSRINGETVTLSELRKVTALLIDIYGQNEFHTLTDKDKHLVILDEYLSEKVSGAKEEVRKACSIYRAAVRASESFKLDEKERLRELDILNYELDEIDAAKLKRGEEEELQRSYKRLDNAQKIMTHVGSAYECLNGFELERAVSDIEEAMRYDEELKGIYDELMDVQAILNSAAHDMNEYAGGLETDEEELSNTEKRLDLIRGLQSKYGRDIDEIFAYRDKTAARIAELDDYESGKGRALKALETARSELDASCKKLHKIREKGAKELCDAVSSELKDLGFDKAQISMEFKDTVPGENGSDEAVFTAALNPGEPLKPLYEVASGGELSRVMLAIKTVLARTDDMPTLIFDEIDSGISGRTAQKVAEKMALIAGEHQVICVSHLPQIAAMADTHFVITKEETDGRNITDITRLDKEGSLDELTRLLGGAKITKAAYDNAVEMKEQADRIKALKRV